MMRMWRFIALALLSLGIAGILRLYFGGFVWKNGLSNDAIAVLFVGVIAFLAVMIQIEEERIKGIEERDGQRRALATAIRFEMDGFYLYYLRGLRDLLKNLNLEEEVPLSVVKPIAANPFSIYQGSARKLGELGPETLERVVAFYNAAGRHVSTRAAWRAHMERILAGEDNSVEREAVRRLAIEIQDALPLQIALAYLACKKVSDEAKLEFEELAVSREPQPAELVPSLVQGGADTERS